jgi:hypothetical protein
MRNFVFLAALIFSATAFDTFSQVPSPTPDQGVKPVAVSTPEPDPSSSSYSPPDGKTRFRRYVNGTVGPFALARQVAGAGISTWRNSPEEWGGQWEGFGKRVASNFGKNLIKQTTIYGLDSALKLDSHYYRSKRKDAGSKIRNALLSPVTARNSSGKRVVGVPRLVGTYTASIVAAETWYPDRYDWKDGAKSATISFGISAAYNLFKEFVWKK